VPTDDREVRVQLRALSHPVTLFGEKQMERRDRLRMLLAQMDAEDGGELPLPSSAELLLEAPGAELFYTEGTLELLTTRTAVMESSLVVAAQRMAAAKRKQESPDEDEAAEEAAGAATAGSLTIECSEMADERPLSGCAFSPDGAELVTCSWSGLCKFWTVDGATKRLVMRAHDERVTGVAFHPVRTLVCDASMQHRRARLPLNPAHSRCARRQPRARLTPNPPPPSLPFPMRRRRR
jgi:U4/U6 small nuclear ribonucleoprotein PRP4